jgi:hypothetical protein
MDINKRLMGEEIYISDLQKEILKTDGVISLINLEVFDKTYGVDGEDYSTTSISQEVTSNGTRNVIDLRSTDGILYNDGDTMMEIKNPNKDITIRTKTRYGL